MKYFKKIITIFFIIFAGTFFFKVGEINYEKQKEIKASIIQKPTSLPKTNYANLTSFGFKNLKADFYRLQMIQYIGINVVNSEYKPYLYTMVNLINNLNPYFEDAYVLGELLLPSYNSRYENLTKEEQEKYINQAIEIGENAVKNFCDMDKIKLINEENNLQNLFTEEKYKNPCKKYLPIYNLAFIYFQYKNDPIKASEYYKIASVIDGTPDGAKTMIAVMQGKGGNTEKSFFMFLNMAKYIDLNNEFCIKSANNLEKVGQNIFFNNMEINSALLKDLRNFSSENFPFDEENGLENTKCTTFLNKAIRELNLHYLDIANKKYKNENGINSTNAKELLDSKFIDYLPIDFQQYEDYGIIYVFNSETNTYDSEMGRY